MADDLDDAQFWLPPKFLVDDDEDDDVNDTKNESNCFNFDNNEALLAKFLNEVPPLFPSEFPYGSDLSSPVESLIGSSETESDEEERGAVTDLTRRFANSTLEDDFASNEKPKKMFGSGSPQSTLCAFGSGCGCRKGSSDGSPNSACQMTSPTATWDLLHAAAGEVEKMRRNNETSGLYTHRGFHPVSLSPSNSADGGLYTQQSLTPEQIRILQLQLLREQQMAKLRHPPFFRQRQSIQMAPIRAMTAGIPSPGNVFPVNFSSTAWPPPVQQPKFPTQTPQQFGPGMRAVFLENPSGKKRECAGTGVFLPRRADHHPSQSKKKTASSTTVLVPARVAQALNLKMDNTMRGHPQPQDEPRFNGPPPKMDSEVAFPKLRKNHGLSHQKRSFQSYSPVNHELRLPQEWTY